uniref:non-specific serine/threonine protein kinase n=1 Tax=Oncorhynchus kisutch TaxID=8019 RepID=A0A8C7KAB4_ONCKI
MDPPRKLGRIIGQGGFGLIYLGRLFPYLLLFDSLISLCLQDYHVNRPLFSELNKKLDFLGIPANWGSGLAEHNRTRFRFMAMDRLVSDLQKVCERNGDKLKKHTVLQLGCVLLDVLEYIHDNEYVHADVKNANLMLGHTDPNKLSTHTVCLLSVVHVYLADNGLSYRYSPDGVHKENKENPKKGHNGTVEYTSIDAQNGVAPSRRGNLEVLGFCLLHWLYTLSSLWFLLLHLPIKPLFPLSPSVFHASPSIILSILSSFPVPAVGKHPHSLMLPPPCLTGDVLLGVMKGVGFAPDIALSLMDKKLNFSLIGPEYLLLYVWGVSHMPFGEHQT